MSLSLRIFVTEAGGRTRRGGGVVLHLASARCRVIDRCTHLVNLPITICTHRIVARNERPVRYGVIQSSRGLGGTVTRLSGVNGGLGRVVQCFRRNKLLAPRVGGSLRSNVYRVCQLDRCFSGVRDSGSCNDLGARDRWGHQLSFYIRLPYFSTWQICTGTCSQ